MFVPRNPEKYVGDIRKIRYMSSWELDAHKFLDNNSKVLRWASEEIKIPYISPVDKKLHNYYPDYWIEFKNRDGEIIQEIIEVKPEAQTKPPSRVGKKKQTQLYEAVRFAVNVAKWRACSEFCDKYNIKFRIVTERQMFR